MPSATPKKRSESPYQPESSQTQSAKKKAASKKDEKPAGGDIRNFVCLLVLQHSKMGRRGDTGNASMLTWQFGGPSRASVSDPTKLLEPARDS